MKLKSILIETNKSNLAIVKQEYIDEDDVNIIHKKGDLEIVFNKHVNLKYYKCYDIILVDTEAEIVEGDTVYEDNLNDEQSIYEIVERNDKLGFFRFRNVFISLDRPNNVRKIIAIS